MNNLDQPNSFYLPSSSSSLLPITTIPSTNHDIYYVYPHRQRKKGTNLVKKNQPQMQLATVTCNTSNKQKNNIDRKRKADPLEPKITRPCSECGKKFWSWKALFGHMRCHPERQWRGINPPPNYRRPTDGNTSFINPPREQQDYFLSTTTTTTAAATISNMIEEEHEVAASLLMLANGDINVGSCDHHEEGCRFECLSCKKVFGSHQALGDHRASHKNVKGCFTITRSGDGCENPREEDGNGNSGVDVKGKLDRAVDNNKLLVLEHKCGICLRVFSSGQALGGHKRCHWEKAEEDGSFSVVKQLGVPNYNLPKVGCCGLDLNLPAPFEDDLPSYHLSSLTNLDLRLGL